MRQRRSHSDSASGGSNRERGVGRAAPGSSPAPADGGAPRDQAADELVRSRERYRLLVETIPHGVEELSVDGTILFSNPAHHRMLGYADGELIGRPVSILLPSEEDWLRLKAFLRDSAREQPPPTPWIGKSRTKGGRLIDVQIDWTYQRDAAGEVVGFVSVVTDITERRDTEEALRESEARFRSLSENLADCMVYQIDTGTDGSERRFTYLSPAVERLHGVTADEATGDSSLIYGQIAEEHRARIAEQETRALAEGTVFECEALVRLPSGEVRWRHFVSAPRTRADGHVVWSGIERDITARKTAEAELQTAHQRLRAHVEHSPLAVIEWDSEFRVVRWAGGAPRLFGWAAEEVVGQKVDALSLVYELDKPVVERAMVGLTSGACPVNTVRNRNVRKDGSVVHCEWYNTSLHDASGRLVSILSQVLDVTERRRAEEALRESESRFRTFMDSSPLVAWIKDADGRVLYANRPHERLLGVRPEDWIGKLDHEIWPRETADALRAEDVAILGSGEPLEKIQALSNPKNGSDSHWLVTKFRVDGPEGRRLVGGVGVEITDRVAAEEAAKEARDHLERRVRERTAQLEEAKEALERDVAARRKAESDRDRMEAQLRQSQALEAVGRLAGGVAHDFNNLLGAVLACAWEAGRPDAGTEQIRRELDRIQDLCRQGGDVTRQLLAVARQSPAVVATLDIGRELERVRLLVERACPRAISVVFDLARGLPRVSGDRSLLTTALLNLCLNARDAMPEGGALTVDARSERADESDWVCIRVQDTGAGIPQDLRDKVFQPFFSTKGPGRGHGLGLPTALATAKAMGGSLTVESEPGRGSVFTLRLPAATTAAGRGAEAVGSPDDAPHEDRMGGTVLVVEDEEDIARMVVRVLADHGCRALRARTGLEAMETVRARAAELNLILLDLMLPGVSGAALHRILRETVPHVPVVFMTGREDLAARADASVPILRKPFTEQDVLECVAAIAPCVGRAGDGGLTRGAARCPPRQRDRRGRR